MIQKCAWIQQSFSLFILLFLFQTAVSDTDSISFTKDTWLNSLSGSTKYGSDSILYFGTSRTCSILLEMNLTPVASKCPSSAVLRLYSSTGYEVTGIAVKINHVQANWGETTVTYNNFNKVVYSTAQYQIQSIGNSWYELSVDNAMLSKAISTESSQVWFFIHFFFFFFFFFFKKKKKKLSLYLEPVDTFSYTILFQSRTNSNKPSLIVTSSTCNVNAHCTSTGINFFFSPNSMINQPIII